MDEVEILRENVKGLCKTVWGHKQGKETIWGESVDTAPEERLQQAYETLIYIVRTKKQMERN